MCVCCSVCIFVHFNVFFLTSTCLKYLFRLASKLQHEQGLRDECDVVSASVLRKRIHSKAHHAEKRKCKELGITGEEMRRRMSDAAAKAVNETFGLDID